MNFWGAGKGAIPLQRALGRKNFCAHHNHDSSLGVRKGGPVKQKKVAPPSSVRSWREEPKTKFNTGQKRLFMYSFGYKISSFYSLGARLARAAREKGPSDFLFGVYQNEGINTVFPGRQMYL